MCSLLLSGTRYMCRHVQVAVFCAHSTCVCHVLAALRVNVVHVVTRLRSTQVLLGTVWHTLHASSCKGCRSGHTLHALCHELVALRVPEVHEETRLCSTKM